MNRLAVIAAALLVATLGTVGCQDNTKKQLQDSEAKYRDLDAKNQEIKKQYDEAMRENADLNSMLQARDAQIADLSRQKKPAAAPAPATGHQNNVPAGWQETATGAKITLTHDILFAPGRATFTPTGLAKLKEVAAAIKSHYPNAMVQVYGFTDKDPVLKSKKLWEDNLDLSANRAMMVTRELTRLGLSAEKIETIAMGATHFVAPNTDKASKAKNRRVEIVAIRKP